MLKSKVSSCHAIAQFVLVSEEGHGAHVRLDVDRLLKEQDAVGFPRNWLFTVGSLCRILELLRKGLDVTERRKGVDVLHRMVSECDKGEVTGKGVPSGGKGWFPQPVPEDTHPLPVSLEQRVLWETEGTLRDSVYEVQRDLLDLLTAEQDEVVLEDQKIVVCDDDEALLFVVPVIDLCHQPDAMNAAVFFLIHQSFDVFDGLIERARPQHKELPGFELLQAGGIRGRTTELGAGRPEIRLLLLGVLSLASSLLGVLCSGRRRAERTLLLLCANLFVLVCHYEPSKQLRPLG